MKENTQEKKLMKRNENSIVDKIKNFFMKLFKKKDDLVDVEEQQENIYKNETTFKDNLKVEELNVARVLELQQKYRNGEVCLKELTNEEIDKLCDLYDEQIEELKKKIKAKSGEIQEYNKRKQNRLKNNNQ